MRVVALVLAALVAVGGCGSARQRETPPSPEPHSLPTSGLLAAVDWTGGLCGNAETCATGLSVDVDGTWHRRTGRTSTKGTLTADELRRLTSAVRGTFLDRAPDFHGTCPVVYDGSEATYRFVRDGRTWIVASCSKEVPSTDPLAVELGTLWTSTG